MRKRWIKAIPFAVVVLLVVLFAAPAQIFPCGSTDLSVVLGECGETFISGKIDAFDGEPYIVELSRFDGTGYVTFESWTGIKGSGTWEKTFTVMLRGGSYMVYLCAGTYCDETIYFDVERCYGEIEYTPAGYIKRLYHKILWREYTADEKQAWLERYAMGWTAADMVKDFVFGEELKERLADFSDGEFLTFIYNATTGREPDMESYDALLERMGNGLTREEVLSEFLMSDEFVKLCLKFKTIPYPGYCETCDQ